MGNKPLCCCQLIHDSPLHPDEKCVLLHTYRRKENHMTDTLFSIADVAKLLGVAEHKINYATRISVLPDATHRVGGIRVFTTADIRRMAEYFGVPMPTALAQEGGQHD